jgi:metal iron transporter
MSIIIGKLNIDWGDVFEGYLPSKTIFASGGLYICKLANILQLKRINLPHIASAIGILGATVMPHGLFLGSALATQDRISTGSPKIVLPSHLKSEKSTEKSESSISWLRSFFRTIYVTIASGFRVSQDTDKNALRPKHHIHWENNSLGFVQAHLYHGMVNMAICLLGFAVLINSS